MEPFDNWLCDLKLKPAINRLHEEAGKCLAKAHAEVKDLGNSARLYPAFVDCRLEVLHNYLDEIDSTMREVRLVDGSVTPEFIRSVLVPRVFSAIAAQKGAIQHSLELTARRRGEHNSAAVHYLIHKINHLHSELAARYEAEAIECGKRARRTRVSDSRFTELREIHAIELVDSNLVRLGLQHLTLDRLLRESPEYLRTQHEQARANCRRLRRAVPEGQIDPDVERAETTEKQFAKALALLGAWPDLSEATSTADLWRTFHDRFMELAREEQGRAHTDTITNGKVLQMMNQVLRTSCDYGTHPEVLERGKLGQGLMCLLDTPPHGIWNYDNRGISENFYERVRLCVAEAGRVLPKYVKGADPEDFWLHCLYLDLLENNSDSLFCASPKGGMIVSICVASATFCARLRRRALEHQEPSKRIGAEHLENKAETLASAVSHVQNNAKTARRPESNWAERNRRPGGRPRNDRDRDLVRKLKADGKTWKEIAGTVNAQTHQNKSPDAYRSLLKSRSLAANHSGKNEQK